LQDKCNHVRAFSAKGDLLMKKEDFNKALQYYYKLLQLDSANAEIYNNIGLCQMRLNQLDLAESFFRKALTLKSKDPIIVYNYGMLMLKKGCYEKAIEIMSKIINKERVEVFSFLGYCYSLLGKHKESFVFYKKALQIAPHYQENLINLACTYAKMGEKEKALEILQKLLRVNPYDVNLLNNIAWVYESLKNYGEAEKNYYRGLALSPQNPSLMYNLICCLYKQHKYCEAMEMITLLKKIPEWNSRAWSSLAQIYEKMGEKNLAVDCYNKAFGLN
jgi:tetratricopeptide (TPR) repeat protein